MINFNFNRTFAEKGLLLSYYTVRGGLARPIGATLLLPELAYIISVIVRSGAV
jgi:hypothetical protein